MYVQFVEAGGVLMENATFKNAEVSPGVGVKLKLVRIFSEKCTDLRKCLVPPEHASACTRK